jgi:hypothetical protein
VARQVDQIDNPVARNTIALILERSTSVVLAGLGRFGLLLGPHVAVARRRDKKVIGPISARRADVAVALLNK